MTKRDRRFFSLIMCFLSTGIEQLGVSVGLRPGPALIPCHCRRELGSALVAVDASTILQLRWGGIDRNGAHGELIRRQDWCSAGKMEGG